MAIYSSLMISLFLITLLASSSSATPIPASGGGKCRSGGLTHIHVYVHETYRGANCTAVTAVASPLGANSSFGSVGVVDDELRVGQDRASELVGQFQGIIVGTSLDGSVNYLTSIRPSPFEECEYSILPVMSELSTVRCDRAFGLWIAGTRASSVDGELPWRCCGRWTVRWTAVIAIN